MTGLVAPTLEQREYEKWAAYGQDTTANVLHAVELDRWLGDGGVDRRPSTPIGRGNSGH